MANKLKKTGKPTIQELPGLRIRYTYVVPLVGIMDTITMLGFFGNPATEGNLFLKVFFLFFALVGIGFAYWGLRWKISTNETGIYVRPAFGSKKNLAFSKLKKIVVHKKKKTGAIVYYELIGQDGLTFVKIYPLMKDSMVLLERLKRFQFPVEEVADR